MNHTPQRSVHYDGPNTVLDEFREELLKVTLVGMGDSAIPLSSIAIELDRYLSSDEVADVRQLIAATYPDDSEVVIDAVTAHDRPHVVEIVTERGQEPTERVASLAGTSIIITYENRAAELIARRVLAEQS